jgi:dipeptidyl-peptidase-3
MRWDADRCQSAAWHGARIILRQVSEESAPIFDLILEIHNALSGDWQSLAARAKIDVREAESFLEFSSSFLSDIGNYSVRTDDSRWYFLGG